MGSVLKMRPADFAPGALTPVDRALLIAALASAGLIAGAHLFERVGGLAPCALCLDQREAHWTGLALAAGGALASFAWRARTVAAAAAGACALIYAVSSGLALYHTGVEFAFWPGPAGCSGGGPVELKPGGLEAALAEGPSGPSCSEAPWRMFGVSMAGYNMIVSAGLFMLCLFAAIDANRQARIAGAAPHARVPR